MVETLAIAAVVTFSVGLGVALAPAIALNRTTRSDLAKASRRRRTGNAIYLRPRAVALDSSDHKPLGLSHDETRRRTLRCRLVKHEL